MWSKVSDSFKILNIVDNDVVNADALKLFFNDFNKILSPNDRLSENYSETNFNIKEHLMFDALYTDANEFVACTGIYKRDYWPDGTYRLLNRTFFSQNFRNSHNFSYFASDYLLPYQIQNCKSKLNFTFVSRQGANGGNFLKKLQQRPFFKENYKVTDMYIQVAPSEDETSFQKILYFKHNPNADIRFSAVTDLKLLPNGIRLARF